jgi:hypothetical protein
MRSFPLAPMTPGLFAMTAFVLVLPVLFAGLAVALPPLPVGLVMGASAVGMVALYVGVWCWMRPTAFQVDGEHLTILWPLRRRVIARANVESARIVEADVFRQEYGYGVRIGVGGLWGGFGVLEMNRVRFSMWVSRQDRYVVVTLRKGNPLLVTPDGAEEFVEALR